MAGATTVAVRKRLPLPRGKMVSAWALYFSQRLFKSKCSAVKTVPLPPLATAADEAAAGAAEGAAPPLFPAVYHWPTVALRQPLSCSPQRRLKALLWRRRWPYQRLSARLFRAAGRSAIVELAAAAECVSAIAEKIYIYREKSKVSVFA